MKKNKNKHMKNCNWKKKLKYKKWYKEFVFFFSILNFGYFIRKVNQIRDKLWLIEYKVEHKKWGDKG